MSEVVKDHLDGQTFTWAVTGVSGFIGSNLLEALLMLDQNVVGIDNFATSDVKNLDQVKEIVGPERWSRFRFVEGDIQNFDLVKDLFSGVDFVLHEAALGSVPRSIEQPLAATASNILGTANVFYAAHAQSVKRVVYATSSSVYGDHPALPKEEDKTGRLLSPYALTKKVNEDYADVFSQCYGLDFVGLRYFNVFGPRQDPNGAYAAVIPKWVSAMIAGESITIFGNGETSRDFCFVENVVEANLLAALTDNKDALNQVYNIAVGDRTTLLELFEMIREELAKTDPKVAEFHPTFEDFRPGDIMHSQANISKAREQLGYNPQFTVKDGLIKSLAWYKENV